jgi:hypothetical protein
MTQVAAPIDPTGPLMAGGEPGDTTVAIPTLAPAVSGQIVGMAGVLQGWSLRESGGTTGANQVKTANTVVGAAISASLVDTAGEQTYCTGFDVTLGVGAAAAAIVVALTGLAVTLDYDMEVSTTQASTLSVRFPQPLPGAAITLSVPAAGGGAAENSLVLYGTDSASVQFVAELYDGQSANGPILATISIAPGASNTQSLFAGALPFRGGLYLNVVAGSGKGAFYVKV